MPHLHFWWILIIASIEYKYNTSGTLLLRYSHLLQIIFHSRFLVDICIIWPWNDMMICYKLNIAVRETCLPLLLTFIMYFFHACSLWWIASVNRHRQLVKNTNKRCWWEYIVLTLFTSMSLSICHLTLSNIKQKYMPH